MEINQQNKKNEYNDKNSITQSQNIKLTNQQDYYSLCTNLLISNLFNKSTSLQQINSDINDLIKGYDFKFEEGFLHTLNKENDQSNKTIEDLFQTLNDNNENLAKFMDNNSLKFKILNRLYIEEKPFINYNSANIYKCIYNNNLPLIKIEFNNINNYKEEYEKSLQYRSKYIPMKISKSYNISKSIKNENIFTYSLYEEGICLNYNNFQNIIYNNSLSLSLSIVHELLNFIYMINLAKSIEFMHIKNIPIGNLHPANIYITNEHEVKIINNNMYDNVFTYKSPEYFDNKTKENNIEILKSSDIWAFGLILNGIFSGLPPWHEHKGDQSKIIKELVNKTNFKASNKIENIQIRNNLIQNCTLIKIDNRPNITSLLSELISIFKIVIIQTSFRQDLFKIFSNNKQHLSFMNALKRIFYDNKYKDKNLFKFSKEESLLIEEIVSMDNRKVLNTLDLSNKFHLGPDLVCCLLKNGLEYLKKDKINVSDNTFSFVTTISTLNLANNQIGFEGMSYFCRCMFLNLTSLNLSNNSIGKIGMDSFTKCSFLLNLTNLDLSGNSIGKEGIEKLKLCNFLKNLTVLNLQNNFLSPVCIKFFSDCDFLIKLTSVNLNNNYIGDLGMEHLSQCQFLNNVTHFYLSDNTIGSEGINFFSKCEYFSKIICLDLSKNKFGNDGLTKFKQMEFLSQLEELNLSYNYLDENAIKELSACFFLFSLTNLDLSFNNIGKNGINYFKDCQFFYLLTNLNLTFNEIDDEGIKFLIE